MNRLLIILVCLVCTNSGAALVLSGTSVKTNLGTLLAANNLEGTSLVYDTNGHLHCLNFFTVLTDLHQPVQIFDVNITTGTARKTNTVGASGRVTGYGQAFTNGWFYRGTSDDGGKSYAFRYHLASGQTETLQQGDAKTLYSLSLSDSGLIVWGNYGKAGIETYNPANSNWVNWGPVDTNYTGAAHYAYTIQADSRYVYVGIGQSPWYLGILDMATTNYATYWSNLTLGTSQLYRGTNNQIYYSTTLHPSGTNIWWMNSGVPVPTNYGGLLQYYYITNNNVIMDDSVFTNRTGKEFDFGFIYPDSTNNSSSLRRSSFCVQALRCWVCRYCAIIDPSSGDIYYLVS